MEQEQSDLDEYFKQRLDHYQKEPRPMAWENIQRHIVSSKPQKNTYKTVAIYLAAASLCLLLAVTYLFMNTTNNKQDTFALTQPTQDTVVSSSIRPQKEVQKNQSEKKNSPKNLAVTSSKNPEISWIQVSVVDKKTVLHLPDSSVVYLNRNTLVSYRSDFVQHREVEVFEGEAYFDVKKQNGQSFVVKSNLAKTEVLGTSFMVRSHLSEEKDEIYVISGKVSITSRYSPSKKIVLLPNEKGWVDKQGFLSYEKIMEENYAAWKEELIVFQNTDLGEVVKTLKEYYGVTVHINNPELLSCRFTGRFEKSSLHDVIQVLSSTFHLSFNDTQGVYTLSGKGCR